MFGYLTLGATVLGLGGLASCVTPGEKLRPRAAFDLQCAEDNLNMTELGGQCGVVQFAEGEGCSMGVSGCGRRATYVMVGSTWVKNDNTIEEEDKN